MKIAILGAGSVGAALGERWAKLGHEIRFGVRDPGKESVRAAVERCGGTAQALPVAQAAAEAEVVVLATPWEATRDALSEAGDLTGRVLLDCTNPIAEGLAGLTVGTDQSAAELVARWAPGARVVKAFNTTGSGNMADPVYAGGRPAMFVAGDDPAARTVALDLAGAIGFEPVDAGELIVARYLEPLAMLWVHLAYREGRGPDFAFALLQR